MDEVRFELAPAGGDYADDLTQIRIEVNGMSLIELVRRAELPSAQADDEEELAGTYVGLVPGYIRMDLAGQFLGGSGTWLYKEGEGKKALLSCNWRGVGCSPLLARGRGNGETRPWDQVEAPHRADWDYDGFSFTFERAQYERALLQMFE